MKFPLLQVAVIFGLILSLIQNDKVQAESESVLYSVWKESSEEKTLDTENFDMLDQQLYTNNHFGYKFYVPENWEVDRHQAAYYTRFFSNDFRLDIFYDDVESMFLTPSEYMDKTIASLVASVTGNGKFKTSHDADVYFYEYDREPLLTREDQNKYAYFFVINEFGVYTYQLKTTGELFAAKKEQIKGLIMETDFFRPALMNPNKNFIPDGNSPHIKLKGDKKSLEIDSNQFVFGIYQEGFASGAKAVEEQLDTTFGTQMFYKHINEAYDPYVDEMVNNGKIPLVTLHFDFIESTTVMSNNVQRVINGEFDKSIKTWAEGIKNTGSPVFVRIGNEMNGNWTNWSHKNISNDPDLYILAYRHIVDIFRSSGTNNAQFIWNPNDFSEPDFSWNQAAVYYPGSRYVDWIGMTAYNFGKTGQEFKYFDDLYEDLYKTYMRAFPGKPMLIGEFASSENAGNKPFFIKEFFGNLTKKYPNIKLVIWFNGESENGFPVDSSDESLAAFRESIQRDDIIKHPLIDSLDHFLLLSVPANGETNNSQWTFTGVATNPDVQEVYLNGKKQSFHWSTWRQFDQSFLLKDGENKISVELVLKDGSRKSFSYYIYKRPSFKISTSTSDKAVSAPVTSESSVVLTGLVKDENIRKMKINGKETLIKWDWRQFDSEPIEVKQGLNEYIIEGYNSSGEMVAKESYYLFKRGAFQVTSPNAPFTNVFGLSKVVTGMAPDSNVSWVKVDGVKQELKWSWSQFDHPLELDYGDNEFYVDGIYEKLNSSGQKVVFPYHERFRIHAPSLELLNGTSYLPEEAIQTSKSDFNVEGIIKDNRVDRLRINGEDVELMYDWKQFSHNVRLEDGLNTFIVEGYSDDAQNKVMTEKVYVYNDKNLFISSPGTEYTETESERITVTGMVPDVRFTSVKVNGIPQTLKWSWRQFDQEIALDKSGNNYINIEAVYEDYVDGRYFSKTLKKIYILHRPSFLFGTPVSRIIKTAPQVSGELLDLSGSIIDSEVKGLKVNGEIVKMNTDGTFTYLLSLTPGINSITLTGYGDETLENRLFSEEVYVFSDKGFRVDTPESTTVSATAKEIKFSGVLEYDSYKSLRINGKETPLLYSWRQFSGTVALQPGENEVVIEADFEGMHHNVPYKYTAKKVYTVTLPDGVSNYEFTTPVGISEETVPSTRNSTEWIGALVKNNNIKAVKVNGIQTPIEYSWRQISVGVPLQLGLNKISIESYKDESYNETLDTEFIYINRE